MSKQYEVHTSSGSIVYVVGAAGHSEEQAAGSLTITNSRYEVIAKFWHPRGFYTTVADAEAPAVLLPTPPAPADDGDFPLQACPA